MSASRVAVVAVAAAVDPEDDDAEEDDGKRAKQASDMGPRCPLRRNRPVSADTSQITTSPSPPPLASLDESVESKDTIRTGPPCPFSTRGSRDSISSFDDEEEDEEDDPLR